MIHPTAVIEGKVELAPDVEIGPYCHLQGSIQIGARTRLEGHVSLGSRNSRLIIGEDNLFSSGAIIGGPPQDLNYKNEVTTLRIGNHNVFREFSTANIATQKGDGETTIGSHNYFMAYVHVGHDCKIGNHVVIANDSHLGGHTFVEDHVVVGGVCAFNQFTHVGKFAFIGGGSVVNKDILPFTKAHGDHAVCRATNKVGLLRNGYAKDEIENIHRAIRILLMGSDTLEDALKRIAEECVASENIDHLRKFIEKSQRGLAR